jgi:hypothetical protein
MIFFYVKTGFLKKVKVVKVLLVAWHIIGSYIKKWGIVNKRTV